MEYVLHLLILICFYSLLSQALNLSSGYTGLISLAHSGFYGIGAYTTAVLSTEFNISFWLNLPLAVLISGLIAFIVSLIALRTFDDFFIICTLGIQIILSSLFNNLMSVTNGPLGIKSIPSIYLFGMELNSKILFLLLSLFFVLLVWYILRNISKSSFGKTLRGISEDEVYIQSIGKNVYQSKIISFTISSAVAAIPGALYAHYISYIDPTTFTVNESIFILAIVIIGGFGNLTGSIIASAFLVLLPEGLRFIGLPEAMAANLRQILYGLILVVLMMSNKNGIKQFFLKKPR